MALGERGRNPLVARSTAEAACALRAAGALEDDPSVRCPDDMAGVFLGGFNITSLAKHRRTRGRFLALFERAVPGAYTYEILRARFIDEVLLGEIEAGLEELVLLGAGLDSRPYRFAEQLRGVRVIEVDHPDSQRSKRARLRRVLGGEPEAVTYLPVDFTSDDLGDALEAAGHDRSARSLFVWSGVSVYLPEEAATGVLAWVGGHGAAASIVFDAAWAGSVDGSRDYHGAAELRAATEKSGEPLTWGLPEGRAEETLARCGLRLERTLDSGEVGSELLARSDGTELPPPYGFMLLAHARGA